MTTGSTGGTIGWPGRVAIGVLRADPPQVFLAESDDVLGRVLALHVVARSRARELSPSGLLDSIRQALLGERWGEAVDLWMQATGAVIDAYPDESIYTDEDLDSDRASIEIRVAPIFEEED